MKILFYTICPKISSKKKDARQMGGRAPGAHPRSANEN